MPILKRWKPKPKSWKSPKFLTVITWCFDSVERIFFFLEYSQTHFLGLNLKVEKLPLFNQNRGLTPLEKS